MDRQPQSVGFSCGFADSFERPEVDYDLVDLDLFEGLVDFVFGLL